ncbi:MAG: anthranilate synthase component I family protein [Alphaproteobacteria bacterium]|nr:anthranilate synthase component I family protein [Alphaproteobacteria bacterium]
MSAPTPEAVARIADRPGLTWLDGGRDGWSVLAWDPVDVVRAAHGWPARARALRGAPRPGEGPFRSGVMGYVGYGAGHAVEAVPSEAGTPEPPVWLARYEHALCHRAGRWEIHGERAFREEARHLLETAREVDPPEPPTRVATTCTREGYEDRVRRILAWIGEGDCYQVNLSRVVRVALDDPFDTYVRLHRASDAAMGAWVTPERGVHVLSNSPEILLSIDGDHLRSDPIKGTRPRGSDPASDRALADELLASAKDAAELAMIVDLVRNDLGRVARYGSVRVEARTLRSHANVHHAHWPVHADLAAGHDAWDALAAVFPPGSVTGAPKVRACQRIAELEPEPRGVYCGAVGYLDDSGRGRWSVAIRTGVWADGTLRYHVGGGVVADSDPRSEWEETEHKGRVLAAAAGVSPPSSSSRR